MLQRRAGQNAAGAHGRTIGAGAQLSTYGGTLTMSGIRQILLGLLTFLQSALSILTLLVDALRAAILVLEVVLGSLPTEGGLGARVKAEERSVP